MKTETMVVEMIWRVFTNKNYRVVIVTPFENQIALIFRRIHEILKSSPLVGSTVIGSTKSPFAINFSNGSAILGFTAGNDGSSVRGQRCDKKITFFIKSVDNFANKIVILSIEVNNMKLYQDKNWLIEKIIKQIY